MVPRRSFQDLSQLFPDLSGDNLLHREKEFPVTHSRRKNI